MKFLKIVKTHRLAAVTMSILAVTAIALTAFALALPPKAKTAPEIRSPHDTNWSTVPDKETRDQVERTFVEDNGLDIDEDTTVDSRAVFGNGSDSILSPTQPRVPSDIPTQPRIPSRVPGNIPTQPKDPSNAPTTESNDDPYAGINTNPTSLHDDP